ncbi:MAG: GNAT family N-acetyltransferase [Robiginitomaculum sp.]|nr:GNAT family N-acetyltransferase [Robiginitomaculum sp.]
MELEPKTLNNKFVTLEPIHESHRELLRQPAGDPETWQLTTIRGDGQYFDRWFDLMLTNQVNNNSISHIVFYGGKVIGHTAFLEISAAFDKVEIGWTWYEQPHRGTKVNPACKHLLLSRAFECGAERVELKTHHKNLTSQSAILKMGAKKEGVLRHHAKMWDGSYRNTVFFSVLRKEWPAVKASLDLRLLTADHHNT